MKNYLTATRLATKLAMLRSGKKSKAFVMVEGATDLRLYSKLFDSRRCEVVVGECKQIVIDTLKICEEQKITGVIGIVDADFGHLEALEQQSSNLFFTDEHDLECMLLKSPAYEDVMREYADNNKLLRFEARKKQMIREILLENVVKIGYLRKLSLEEHLELRFSQLAFQEFVSISDLEIKDDLLINSILFHSKKQNKYSMHDITKLLRRKSYPEDHLWQVCCGHDLMELLTLGLGHLFGNYNAKKLISGQLEGSFRLAYQKQYFEETKLYESLRAWEEENKVYALFEKENCSNVG